MIRTEAKRVQGQGGQFAPALPCNSPVEILVMQLSGVRRLQKAVFRRAAKPLGVEFEMREHVLLRHKAIEHPTLQGSLFERQRQRRDFVTVPVQKSPGAHSRASGVIGGELEHIRDRKSTRLNSSHVS